MTDDIWSDRMDRQRDESVLSWYRDNPRAARHEVRRIQRLRMMSASDRALLAALLDLLRGDGSGVTPSHLAEPKARTGSASECHATAPAVHGARGEPATAACTNVAHETRGEAPPSEGVHGVNAIHDLIARFERPRPVATDRMKWPTPGTLHRLYVRDVGGKACQWVAVGSNGAILGSGKTSASADWAVFDPWMDIMRAFGATYEQVRASEWVEDEHCWEIAP